MFIVLLNHINLFYLKNFHKNKQDILKINIDIYNHYFIGMVV